MSHKYVSNKAVLQDKGFLNKLGATLASRSNPDPNLEIKEKSSLTWRKTSQVRRRIRTATGTIPIYADMTEDEEAAIEAEAVLISGGGAEVSGEAAVAIEAAAIEAGVVQQEETRTVTKTTYTVLDNYTPEDTEGLEVVAGQTVELVDKSSPHKRQKVEGDEEEGTQLLDNSAARHKMAIRPKRNHPDPRSRGHDVAEERWLMRDPESGKEGLVPAASLEFHSETTSTEVVSSLKRNLQQAAMSETLAVKKNLMKEIRDFKSRKLSAKLLGPTPEDEARAKRKATIRELIETEEEFVRDLQFVMEHYYSLMEKPNTPRAVRDHKELIFNNFKFIADFHQSVLIEGVKYHAEVPTMVARTFLRLERDFDKHAEYCSNEPLAQEFVANNIAVKEFFDEFSQRLGDDKNLQEHLKLPIQRLNDYQLLLKELVKFTSKLGEETDDLERAYELMQTIPQRATDAKFITSIEGFKGNLFKLGRLIRHDWFSVREAGEKPRDRYLFLFKARILITKVKRISEDRSVFILKDIIRLPETSLGTIGENPKSIEFFHIESLTHPNFPIFIEARTAEIKEAWLQGIKEYVVDTASVEDLLFDDELRVLSQDIDEEDAGIVSPVPELQEFEDLPEDGEAAPVPGDVEKREPSPPAKRQKAEVGATLSAAGEQQQPSPAPEQEPVKASTTLEQVEEQKVVAEQEKPSSDQPSPKEPTPASQQAQQEAAKLQKEKEEIEKKEKEEKEKKEREEKEKKEQEEQEKKEREEKEKEEKEKKEKEETLRKEKEEKDRLEKERLQKEKEEIEKKEKEEKEKALKLKEEKEKKEREEKELKEKQEKEKKEAEEKKKKEKEEKEKKEKEELEIKQKEEKEKKEKEEKERKAKEEKAKLEKEAKEKKEKEEKEKLQKEKEEKEKREKEIKAKEEKEKKEKEERERKAKEEKEKLEREEKEKKAKEEKEKLQKEKEKKEKEEKERKEKEEKEKLQKEKAEKEKKEKEELERKAKEEKEKKDKEEKEKKEKEEKEKKEKEEKEKKEKEEKERKAKEEKEKKEKEERELKAKEEKEKLQKDKAAAEKLAKEKVKKPKTMERSDSEGSVEDAFEKMAQDAAAEEAVAEEAVDEFWSGREGGSPPKDAAAKKPEEAKKLEEAKKEPAKVEVQQPKAAEAAPAAKPVEAKPTPPPTTTPEVKPAEVKPTPPPTTTPEVKPVEVKPAPPPTTTPEVKPAEVKPTPPPTTTPEVKPVEVKPAPPPTTTPEVKPAEVKPIPPPTTTPEVKPAEVKPAKAATELPKLVVPAAEPPKAEAKKEVKAQPPKPATGKMAEPTTPSTPGGTPKPVFTKTVKGDVVDPGESVSFSCTVVHPVPYFVTWLKDNKPLDDKLADRVQAQDSGPNHSLKITDDGNKHTLQVLNCRTQDSGIYTAKATDEKFASATCSAQLLVQELTEEERSKRIAEKSPFFLVRMKKTEVIEHTNLSYTIHVRGDPMPDVEFFKDNKEIKEDERVVIRRDKDLGHYELLISDVTPGDEGTYKSIAKNKFGRAECEAAMHVNDEDTIYESLSGKGSLLGKGEKAEFKWFRDGAEYIPTERFNVMFKDDEDTLALVFQNVTPEDAGLYTCVASTSCGKISCSAELTVEGAVNRLMKEPEPPVIKEELSSAQVSTGGSAMMEVKIGGYPKPELTWTRNGLDVKIGGRIKLLWEDDESVALIIKNVEESDAGLYCVSAKNDLGIEDSMAQLTIKAGPKITKMRKDISCIIGKDLEYSVEVRGEPPPDVKWLKEGKQMMESHRIKFEKISDTLWTLTMKEMEMGDCACYTVVVANSMGQVSEFFNLETDAAPQISRGLDPEMDKKKGYDLILEVRASGSPRPEPRWFKDGRELMSDGDKYKITKEDNFYMLKIRNLERKDKGKYKVDLTNASGTATSETVLSVRAPPDFLTPLKDVYAKEGSKDVKLFVEWEATPKASVKWFFKDKALHEDSPGYTIRSTETTTVLTIHEATEEFVGCYNFRATNEYGDSNCSGRFLLHEFPVITEGLADTEFLEGRSAKFSFKATGCPPPDIKWTKNGKKWTPDGNRIKMKQEGEDTYVLYFDESNTEDAGHYVATISNVEGSVTTEGTVVVNTPPHIKKSNFKDGKTFIAMHKFLLEVEATAVPEAEATWFFNGNELKAEEDNVKFNFDGKKYTMERIGGDPEHSGEYKCVLKNKISTAEEVGVVTVKEKEARVRNPLEDMYVIENTDAILKCQIVGDPIPTIEWLRNGKPLPQSERFEVSEERLAGWHTILVKGVTEQDKATYTVKGKNQHGECETTSKLGILVKPQPGELKDAVVDYGKDLLLNVAIHAFPPPKIVWTMNGEELVSNGHFEYTRDEENEVYGLSIKSAVLEDAGKIIFTAENRAGNATGFCLIKVHTEKPTIVANLEHLMTCLEDDATFTLRASGLPLPDCTWKMNDKVVTADDRHVFSSPEPGVFCLTVKDVNMQDYGVVTVVGKSLVGECNSAGKMSQKKLMCEVIEGLENVTKGAEGEDVTLSVKIKASPRPEFFWTKDGDACEASEKIKIEMKKTSYCEATISLTLVDASSIESGQYRLKFTNELNSSSSETALIIRPVRRKPKIARKPNELEVMETKLGIFQTKITGFPKPEVKWMKEGRQVYPTDIIDMGVTAEGLYYLEFRSVSSEDVGKYTVYAVNDEGHCKAETHLKVIPPPSRPEFIQSLKASKVIMGYPVRLEVQLGGYPTPEVQWLKDGNPIQLDGTHCKQIVEPDGTVILQIDKASESDMGEITCVAKNPEGDSSSSAKLSVLNFKREDGQPDGPAKFSESLKDMCYDEGKNIRLPVGMKGGPVPNMKWYKDGEEIKLDDRIFYTYDGDRAYLEIRPCKGSDAGKYKCVIQNAHGSDETECEVSIRKCFEAPFLISTFPNQAKLPGRDVKMSIKVDAVPKPEISWYFNGEPIDIDGGRFRIRKDGEGQTLLLKDCTYSDAGTYKVVAKNREGEVEHEATLEVADDVDPNKRAEAPVFLKVIGDQELFESANALFKAIVTGRPEPEYKWLKNGGTIISTNRVIIERDHDGLIRLTIKNITPEDAGVYQLKVWNEHGEKTCQGKLICETLTSKLKRPIGDEYLGFDRVRRSGVPMPVPDKPMISALSERRATISWMPYLPTPPCTPVTYQLEMMECPEGEWFTYRTGIRGCGVDVSNLNSKSDYRFRVRVENKHGVSEPSPYITSHRYKLDLPAINYEPQMDSNYVYKGDGPYVPEGFRISRDYKGNYFAAPRFLKLDYDTQYGLKGFNASIKWYAYGYPTPKLRFIKDGKPLVVGGKGNRFTNTQEATGEICLFIERMTEEDMGLYECYVKNEHGESKQRIKLHLADYPRIQQPLEELHLKANSSGKITCRISGYPPCQVRWYRDWEPISSCFRMRPSYAEPDTYILNITGAQVKDSGLYSISAANVAGNVHTSCMVHVEEDDLGFFWYGPTGARQVSVNSRRGTLEDHYDVGDELGRGTQGVVYHCAEHHTGRNFAAKSMWGKDKLKVWMHMELEMMNLINSCRHIVRLYDAYEGPKNMVLVTELCGGGDLLSAITQQQYLTEYEVCCYIRQILVGLEYMHDRCIAHLGINIGDILLSRPNGREIKIGDLSLARQIRVNKAQPLDYGMPEFVAPEVAKGEGVTYAVDMWAVGIITYLLLSGTSPFRGENDRDTLTRVQKGELTFDMDAFSHVSNEGKDFIAKLLIYKADARMDIKKALLHPWLNMALAEPKDQHKINTDRLRTYYARFRDWYGNASCKRWFRRRPLSSCFTHPSKMVYPPGEVYTPPESPEREILPEKADDYDIMNRDYSYELDTIKNESNYQMGPDTYLLQLRDVDFPCRLRSYMKVATARSPAYAMSVRENDYDYQKIPVVHERRRFTDVMDEEIDDERRRTSLDKYTAGFIRSRMETCALDMPRRVKHEVSSRLTMRDTTNDLWRDEYVGKMPFMREKPRSCAITDGQQLTLTCVFTGDPMPTVQWFKNDLILGETERCAIKHEPGKTTLTYEECRDFDVGQYKVVARNTLGQVTHRFRLVHGHIPGPCDCPEVPTTSGTEVMVRWRPPITDGGHPIQCYHLQRKPQGETEWETIHDRIIHEFYLVRGLAEDSLHQFRVAAKNFKGWGEFSVSTPAVRTASKGTVKVKTNKSMQYLQQMTESGKTPPDFEKRALDYNRELDPVKLKTGENAELQVRKYQFVAEVARGRYSVIIKCLRTDDKRQFVAKIIENKDREESVKAEHEVLKWLRHDRIAQLYESYNIGGVTMLIMEQLTGIDILTYLASKHEYSEQNIVTVILQVLDALSYLHWRGHSYLDLQPDNVVMTTCRRTDIKLVDLGSTKRVSKLGSKVPVNGLLDYIAPEVLSDFKAYPTSDIWSLGVLTYALMAGASPFKGVDDDETRQNIQYVRYMFEHLSSSTSQEAIRFLMLLFKRDPSKRPTVEDCREHKWLTESDYMVKKRERATFLGVKLRDYDDSYHKAKTNTSTKSAALLSFNDMHLPKEYTYDPDMFCVL